MAVSRFNTDLFRNDPIGLASNLLRAAVVLSSIGYASQLARGRLEVNTSALTEWGMASWLSSSVPVLGAAMLLAVAVVVAVVRRGRLLEGALWIAIGTFGGLTALATFRFGQYWGLTPFSRAARVAAPVGLLLLVANQVGGPVVGRMGRSIDRLRSGGVGADDLGRLLRLAIAATFVGHGLKVLFHQEKFVGLLLGSQRNVLGATPIEGNAVPVALDIIGLADLVVAALVVTTRNRLVPLYLSGWTLLTASSRVMANGWASWDDVPIRAGYFLIPLAILALAESGVTGRPRPESVLAPERAPSAVTVGRPAS